MSTTSSTAVVQRGTERRTNYVLLGLLVPVIIVLLAPSLVVLPMSVSENPVLSWPPQGFTLRWYGKLIANPGWLDSAKNSLEVAFAATGLSLVVGIPAGLTFGSIHWRGKQLALAFVVAPLVIPTIILAIGMYEVYARLGLVDLWGLAVGHAVIGTPFVVVTTMLAVRQIDPVLLLAARSLGAPPFSVFIHVTLPTVALGVLSGAVFAFVASWDEVVIANFLTTPTFKTIPVLMWDQLTEGSDPTVAAMASTLFIVTVSITLVLAFISKSRR